MRAYSPATKFRAIIITKLSVWRVTARYSLMLQSLTRSNRRRGNGGVPELARVYYILPTTFLIRFSFAHLSARRAYLSLSHTPDITSGHFSFSSLFFFFLYVRADHDHRRLEIGRGQGENRSVLPRARPRIFLDRADLPYASRLERGKEVGTSGKTQKRFDRVLHTSKAPQAL